MESKAFVGLLTQMQYEHLHEKPLIVVKALIVR
jgi:hypothetical protein